MSLSESPFFSHLVSPSARHRNCARQTLDRFSTEDLEKYALALQDVINKAAIETSIGKQLLFQEMMLEEAKSIIQNRKPINHEK